MAPDDQKAWDKYVDSRIRKKLDEFKEILADGIGHALVATRREIRDEMYAANAAILVKLSYADAKVHGGELHAISGARR